MEDRTSPSEGPNVLEKLRQPCGDMPTDSLLSPTHKSPLLCRRLWWISSHQTIDNMLSLPTPLRTFWLQRVQNDEPVDLEDQGQITTPSSHLLLRRKGRIPVTVVVVGSLVLLTTLSLAFRVYLLGPKKELVLDSPTALAAAIITPDEPALLHGSSSRWAPTIITECTPHTQHYYAPCIVDRTYGAIGGQELIYPDFQLREPIFAQSRLEEDQRQWRTFVEGIRERAARCSDEWYCYRGQHGQNIILANATYTGSPPADTWSDEACMSDGVSVRGISVLAEGTQLSDAEYAAAYPVESLLVATSPDSWSFQHFLDRITHIVAQGADLAKNPSALEAITGRKPDHVVAEMWDMLGFPESRVHHYASAGAKEIIFGCRTPLSHPYPSLRILEKFGLNNTRVSLEERKKIVYFSRSQGHSSNGGRRVINEEDLLEGIHHLLLERGQGEELVVFQQDDFQSQRELMTWFETNVRAVIGPHGGALYNHRWAGLDTLVVEFTPTSRPSQMFWEEASMLGQIYANLIIPSGADTNMDVDIPAVLEILTTHLGKPDARGPAINEAYRWHAPEVMGSL